MSDRESLLIDKIGQAYQIIGTLSSGITAVPESEWERALDYFADETRYDDDFLPWPREYALPASREQIGNIPGNTTKAEEA